MFDQPEFLVCRSRPSAGSSSAPPRSSWRLCDRTWRTGDLWPSSSHSRLSHSEQGEEGVNDEMYIVTKELSNKAIQKKRTKFYAKT